jgi:hypothetical protein
MTENGRKILEIKWWWKWGRDHPVSAALHYGVTRPWHQKIAAELKRRRETGSFPRTQAQLCEMAGLSHGLFVNRTRKARTIKEENKEDRKRITTNPVVDLRQLFLIASILDLPVNGLLPSLTEVLTLATQVLCNGDAWERPTIGYTDSFVYADYRLRGGGFKDELNQEILHEVVETMPQNVNTDRTSPLVPLATIGQARNAICQVAEMLGIRLSEMIAREHDRDGREPRGDS